MYAQQRTSIEREIEIVNISVIGAGAIGGNLARLLSKAGHDVLVADARGPEAVQPEAIQAGARAVEMEVAVDDRDVIILSIPFSKQPSLTPLLATVPDRTVVVDTSNYYPHLTGRTAAVDDGQVESVWAQEQLGRPIVKAWNAGLAETQRSRGLPAGAPGRIALPVAADSAQARETVMRLVDDTGFDAVDAGSLAESWRQQPGTPAYCTELSAEQLREALAAADKDAAPGNRDRLMAGYASQTTPLTHDDIVATNRAGTAPTAGERG
jgi:predicted dinucleotide-binding enzyme